jgi:hypothetical protein
MLIMERNSKEKIRIKIAKEESVISVINWKNNEISQIK